MTFVDIHAHLDFEVFDNDRDDLLSKLKENKIVVYTNTLNYEEYLKSVKLFENYDNINVCPGLYPQEAEKYSTEQIDEYCTYLKKNKDSFLAIGEVGLDRHHTKKSELWDIQEKHFRKLIELAIQLNKPLIIHTRKAEVRTLEIIREYVESTGFKKFNLHCFTGKKKLIKEIKSLGIYCSIPLTVLNTESFQILVRELPIKQLLVETDSPFLNPNKERNTPLNVPLIYDKIADIKGYDKKEIQNIIYRNVMKLVH